MTLYDLRNGGDQYSGIAAVCPECGGPIPVETNIAKERCPLCDSILNMEFLTLIPGDAFTDETDQEDTDADQEEKSVELGTLFADDGDYGGDDADAADGDAMAEMDVLEPPQGDTQEDYFMQRERVSSRGVFHATIYH